MKPNMGKLDRQLRLFIVAPVLVVIGIVLGPTAVLSIVLYALAAVMIATSLVGFCPIYTLLGIRTCPAPTAKRSHAG